MVKGTYKGPNDHFHRIQSRSNSGVSEVEAEIAALFSSLPDPNVDGTVTGYVVGYTPPHFYLSCNECRRKVPSGITNCPGCNKSTKEIQLNKDFNTTIQGIKLPTCYKLSTNHGI